VGTAQGLIIALGILDPHLLTPTGSTSITGDASHRRRSTDDAPVERVFAERAQGHQRIILEHR
jgi:hypothetical protein